MQKPTRVLHTHAHLNKVRMSVWYTHEHLLSLAFERQIEISQVSMNRITSVSKRFRCFQHTKAGLLLLQQLYVLQDLRLLVPRLEQSSAFLLPADRGVTVLHLVSDVIQSNLKWRINPNSPAKIQKKIEIQKIMNNIFKKITNLFFTTTIYYLATLPENIDTFLRKQTAAKAQQRAATKQRAKRALQTLQTLHIRE